MPAKKPVKPRAAGSDLPRPRRFVVPVLLAAAALGLAVYLAIRIASPDVVLLIGENGASWIRRERAFSVAGFGGVYEQVLFQRHVTATRSGGNHTLTIHALRTCRVFWDHQEVACWSPDKNDWKEPWQAELTDVTPGEHTLGILVDNTFGPAAVMAYCDSLGVRTGHDWQEWHDTELRPVATVDEVELPEISQKFVSPVHALRAALVWSVPLFVAAWAGLAWLGRLWAESKFSSWCTASRCRWFVMAAWVVLAANNFLKLPPDVGNDLSAHVDYLRFIAEHGRLPDARNGLEMYQAPLYYLLSAGVYRVLTLFVSTGTALLWLRWIPLLCGIGFVEICFRAGRCVFPQREDLQSLTVVLGGLLPMNLYTSQVLSNEPLSALLGALVVLFSLEALRDPIGAHRPRFQWMLGLVLGLAILAKVSALLLVPAAAVVLVVANADRGWGASSAALARCLGIAVLVGGWYYARNWMIFGKPVVGNWDVETGIPWWQDPGYRTPSQMASFGAALWHPIHAAFYSVWDGFYGTLWWDGNLSSMGTWASRPPWNESLMLAAPWPALILSVMLVAGAMRGVACRDAVLRRPLQFAAGILLVYLIALGLFCLEVPAYSTAKASYTLALTPVYGVLCAASFDLLPRRPAIRSAAAALVVWWSVLAYGAYFVI